MEFTASVRMLRHGVNRACEYTNFVTDDFFPLLILSVCCLSAWLPGCLLACFSLRCYLCDCRFWIRLCCCGSCGSSCCCCRRRCCWVIPVIWFLLHTLSSLLFLNNPWFLDVSRHVELPVRMEDCIESSKDSFAMKGHILASLPWLPWESLRNFWFDSSPGIWSNNQSFFGASPKLHVLPCCHGSCPACRSASGHPGLRLRGPQSGCSLATERTAARISGAAWAAGLGGA